MLTKEQLAKDLNQLKSEWKKMVSELREMMYSTDEKWQAERKKIKALKSEHPFQPENPNFSTSAPRIIREKTIVLRDEQHIAKYIAFYKKITNYSPDILEAAVASIANPKKQHALTGNDFAAYALLLANRHHLWVQFCQENTNTDGLSHYIATKMQRAAAKDTSIKPVSDNLRKILQSELQEARKKKIEKRREYNRTLNVDLLTDAHIQNLLNQGFAHLEVDVKESDANRRTVKKIEIPTKFIEIEKNTIVSSKIKDKHGNVHNRVLAILINDKVKNKLVTGCMQEIMGLPKTYWERDIRSGEIGKGNHGRKAPTKINSAAGKQITFGMNNFRKKDNNLNRITQQKLYIWTDHIKPLGKHLQSIFKELLPTTYQSVMNESEELRDAGLYMDKEVPFSSVSINLKNAVRPHRDGNFHNYSAMIGFEKNGKKLEALTAFPEWTHTDPKTQETLPIAFKVAHMGLLLADTDYVHFATEAGFEKTERVTMVWYAYRDLMAPAFLLCADSDLDEDDYEPDTGYAEQTKAPKKKKTKLSKSSGKISSASHSNSSSSNSSTDSKDTHELDEMEDQEMQDMSDGIDKTDSSPYSLVPKMESFKETPTFEYEREARNHQSLALDYARRADAYALESARLASLSQLHRDLSNRHHALHDKYAALSSQLSEFSEVPDADLNKADLNSAMEEDLFNQDIEPTLLENSAMAGMNSLIFSNIGSRQQRSSQYHSHAPNGVPALDVSLNADALTSSGVAPMDTSSVGLGNLQLSSPLQLQAEPQQLLAPDTAPAYLPSFTSVPNASVGSNASANGVSGMDTQPETEKLLGNSRKRKLEHSENS